MVSGDAGIPKNRCIVERIVRDCVIAIWAVEVVMMSESEHRWF